MLYMLFVFYVSPMGMELKTRVPQVLVLFPTGFHFGCLRPNEIVLFSTLRTTASSNPLIRGVGGMGDPDREGHPVPLLSKGFDQDLDRPSEGHCCLGLCYRTWHDRRETDLDIMCLGGLCSR